MHAADQRLAAYLAGDLDPDTARAVDEHLLDCEDCWQAVCAARLGRRAAEQLRQPTPATLADRVRLAVELATTGAAARRSRARRGRWLAVAAGTMALVAAVVTAALLPPRHSTRHDPPVITALVHLAADPTAGQTGAVDTDLAGQTVTLRHYPVEGGAVVVATSTREFPTPPGAQPRPGAAMAWTITRDTVTVYCPHNRVLLAGPVPASTLIALAQRLNLD
jgi:anti-sigma factor RsiW